MNDVFRTLTGVLMNCRPVSLGFTFMFSKNLAKVNCNLVEVGRQEYYELEKIYLYTALISSYFVKVVYFSIFSLFASQNRITESINLFPLLDIIRLVIRVAT